MVEMYKGFCKDYPVISIEDPFDQDDSDHISEFTAKGVRQALQTKTLILNLILILILALTLTSPSP